MVVTVVGAELSDVYALLDDDFVIGALWWGVIGAIGFDHFSIRKSSPRSNTKVHASPSATASSPDNGYSTALWGPCPIADRASIRIDSQTQEPRKRPRIDSGHTCHSVPVMLPELHVNSFIF